MYLGVDIGGTKTLVATLDEHGLIQEKFRFLTPLLYKNFLSELKETLDKLTTKKFLGAAVGVPGRLDRKRGVAIALGNLPWHDVPIQQDIHQLLSCPVKIENDAKLAALSEALLLSDDFTKVLYITVSTGIGIGVITNGKIELEFGDGGGRSLLLEHEGTLQPWEMFSSGKAISKTYGRQARDIYDAKTWRAIAHNLAQGVIDLIAIVEPDVVVFGGGVGQYLSRFGKFLEVELKRYENPMLSIPPIRAAKRPEEAVLYGCYAYAKASYG